MPDSQALALAQQLRDDIKATMDAAVKAVSDDNAAIVAARADAASHQTVADLHKRWLDALDPILAELANEAPAGAGGATPPVDAAPPA